MDERKDKKHILKDAVWFFGDIGDPGVRWAAQQVRDWVPRITGCPACLGAKRSAGLSIAVGTVESSEIIRQATEQGTIAPRTLGEDDFILKTTMVGDEDVLLIAGRTARAAAYGVCEFFERMGCTFLISGDRLPSLDPDLEVPVFDETQHTSCSWRGIWFGGYCFVANAMFSLPDYEAMFDQMVKLKMNRIVFYHFPQEPFIDYTFRGERKLVGDISHPDSGYISYGREFTGSWLVKDMPVGREKFEREKLCPPEFQNIANSAEALDSAKAFMRNIIAMARERGIGVWTSFLPQFTTPNLTKYVRPMAHPHSHWSAHLSCTDPAVGPLNRARLEGIMEAYPDLEGVFLSIPEGFFEDPYPETEALLQREWGNYAEALELLRKYWGKFWPGTKRQNEHMRADIAFTEIVKRTIAEAKELNPCLKLGVCTVCKAYLLTHLHDIFPKDMPFIDIESRALWTLDGAPLHLFQRMKGRECAIIPRAVDDGSLAGMQFPLWQYSKDRFLQSAEENGTAGLMIQTTHIRGNEHSMRYLADGMWGGCREPAAFYREYAERVFGEVVADRIVEAFTILENNDEYLGGRGQKNLPWNMLPQHIGIMKSFRDFDRPFDSVPFAVENVQAFERTAEKFTNAIGYLSQALVLLEEAKRNAHESGRRELAYIVSRTKGYRAHLQALVDITALYRRYYELFDGPRDDLDVFRRELAGLAGDAARLEAQTRKSARHFEACVSHTTDLAVLWMVSHKMVLGTQCLHRFLTNIQAFYDGREYWKPVPWDKLFGRSVYPTYTLDRITGSLMQHDCEPG